MVAEHSWPLGRSTLLCGGVLALAGEDALPAREDVRPHEQHQLRRIHLCRGRRPCQLHVVRKETWLSAEAVPVAAYGGISKNLKDLNSTPNTVDPTPRGSLVLD